jgi:RNA polymerase sigma-70 factor (ECF subfamily)
LTQVPDKTLIENALTGSDSAFEQLVLRYQDRLVRSIFLLTGSMEESLDIAQQAFLLAWQKLSSFRGDSAFYSWLSQIARNLVFSESRRTRNRARSVSLDNLSDHHQALIEPETENTDHLDREEQIQAVRDALLQIPEIFRQPLILKELEGLNYEQIHEVLNIPIGTVRSRIFRARMELTERLKRTVFKERMRKPDAP